MESTTNAIRSGRSVRPRSLPGTHAGGGPTKWEWNTPTVPGMACLTRGEYLDGLGNKVYVYAVGNPEVGKNKNRYQKAHEKGSGFGLVTIDTDAKTYRIESFRFLIDPTDGDPANQFPGWPVTLHQKENSGDNLIQ